MLVAAQREDALPGLGVPEPGRLVGGGGENGSAARGARGEDCRPHGILVAQREEALPGLGAPEPGRLVVGCTVHTNVP